MIRLSRTQKAREVAGGEPVKTQVLSHVSTFLTVAGQSICDLGKAANSVAIGPSITRFACDGHGVDSIWQPACLDGLLWSSSPPF
jgi:hypothetical protein